LTYPIKKDRNSTVKIERAFDLFLPFDMSGVNRFFRHCALKSILKRFDCPEFYKLREIMDFEFTKEQKDIAKAALDFAENDLISHSCIYKLFFSQIYV